MRQVATRIPDCLPAGGMRVGEGNSNREPGVGRTGATMGNGSGVLGRLPPGSLVDCAGGIAARTGGVDVLCVAATPAGVHVVDVGVCP